MGHSIVLPPALPPRANPWHGSILLSFHLCPLPKGRATRPTPVTTNKHAPNTVTTCATYHLTPPSTSKKSRRCRRCCCFCCRKPSASFPWPGPGSLLGLRLSCLAGLGQQLGLALGADAALLGALRKRGVEDKWEAVGVRTQMLTAGRSTEHIIIFDPLARPLLPQRTPSFAIPPASCAP
jgi:hypothetical protein